MKDLWVDLDLLHKTWSDMWTYSNDLNGYIVRFDAAMYALKNSNWQSAASKEFFKNYDTSWQDDIKLFIKIVNEMCDGLADAIDDYYIMSEINMFKIGK